MAHKSTALLRVVTGRGIIPRPAWLERMLTMFDRKPKAIDLSRLSDEQLSDLGLTRDEVDAEMRRPAWDAPLHWYRS